MSIALFDREAVGAQPADVRAYISASRLNLWLKCPLAFKFKYIDGIREPTPPALFLGKAVHSALECYYRHRLLGLAVTGEELARRLLETWGELVDAESMVFESVTEEQAFQRQAVELVAAYLRTVPAAEPKPLAVEVSAQAPLVDPLTGEDLGIPLVGIMDLVLDEEAGPLIADFKTAARNSEPLEITHEIQLSCYAYLFRHSSPVEESGLEIRSLVKTCGRFLGSTGSPMCTCSQPMQLAGLQAGLPVARQAESAQPRSRAIRPLASRDGQEGRSRCSETATRCHTIARCCKIVVDLVDTQLKRTCGQ
ncbi:MAG TPA: PD-(D/E)XK nuclease family protein [Pirellulales bacterium]|nr:PD-(D/E)XK nuclease family protein [Pirellulales bacterium]